MISQEKIKMVDLNGQYLKIKDQIDEAIQKVIDKSIFIKGPDVHDFEESLSDFLQTEYVIGCGNGTDALQIALMAMDLVPGDEVITTTFSFIATVETIALLGLKPVLVDVDPRTFNVDIEAVKKAITPATRAIIPVHLYGQCSDMDSLMAIAKENQLYIIEDNAQALGASYTFRNGETHKAGTMGHIGTSSFFPSKNLGAYGDGGALFTDDKKLADKIRAIINHGTTVKYYHERLGVNSRLDTIQAAILKVKLAYLASYILARQKVADFYDHAFKGISGLTVPSRNPQSDHIFHQYTIKLSEASRDRIKIQLAEAGIPSMVYYPVPMHLQKAFTYLGHKNGDFPVSENLCARVLSLPMHTELTENQLTHITQTLIKLL